jgi:hypothetical protein
MRASSLRRASWCSSCVVFLIACAGPAVGDDAASAAPQSGSWTALFDGRALGDFAPTAFGGEGEVRIEDGRIVLDQGGPLTGITWRGAPLPTGDYELELRATRLAGNDFFCGLTLPVGTGHASLVLGGWGGTLCGISSLDGLDASENETTRFLGFETGREYRVRVAVDAARLRAWLDDEPIVDVPIAGRRVTVRPEVALSRPVGIAAFATRAAFREIRWRPLARVSGS